MKKLSCTLEIISIIALVLLGAICVVASSNLNLSHYVTAGICIIIGIAIWVSVERWEDLISKADNKEKMRLVIARLSDPDDKIHKRYVNTINELKKLDVPIECIDNIELIKYIANEENDD